LLQQPIILTSPHQKLHLEQRSSVRDLAQYPFNTSQSTISGMIQSEKAVLRGKQFIYRLEAGLSIAMCNAGRSLPSLPHFLQGRIARGCEIWEMNWKPQ